MKRDATPDAPTACVANVRVSETVGATEKKVTESNAGEQVHRAAASVAIFTLLSRATGMARVLTIGAVLGPTYLANIFQAGYTLPNNVFTIFAGPMVSMVVIPAVVRSAIAAGNFGARDMLSRVAGRLVTVACLCAAGLVLTSPLLGWSLVLGVPEAQHQRAWLLATLLIMFVAPQIVFYTVVSLAVAAQQSQGRFALAAGAPMVEGLGTIGIVVAVGHLYGSGFDVGRTPLDMIIWLGAGSTAAVAVHTALQLYGTARVGLLVAPRWGLRHSTEAQDCVRRIVRSVPVAACPATTNYLLSVIASTVPGGVLVIQLATQVFYALSYITGRAVSMAALPRLAKAAAEHDWLSFAAAWRRCLHYALLSALPPLCLLVVFAGPTADLMTNGQLREGDLVSELAACLAVAAVGQLIAGVHDLGRQALFSRLDDRGPQLASTIGLVASALIAFSTLFLHPDGGRLTALTVAIVVGEIVSAVTVIDRLRQRIQPERLTNPRNGLHAVLATLAMVPAIGGGLWLLRYLHLARIGELALLAGTAAFSLALFAVTVVALDRPSPQRERLASSS